MVRWYSIDRIGISDTPQFWSSISTLYFLFLSWSLAKTNGVARDLARIYMGQTADILDCQQIETVTVHSHSSDRGWGAQPIRRMQPIGTRPSSNVAAPRWFLMLLCKYDLHFASRFVICHCPFKSLYRLTKLLSWIHWLWQFFPHSISLHSLKFINSLLVMFDCASCPAELSWASNCSAAG